jgi:coenzyme Q-binding protein COQ10
LIEFEIDFEFSSRLLDALLRANVGYAMNRLIGCFEDRARALYGSAT